MKGDIWIVHKAKHTRSDGAVSALCFKTDKPIDMSRADYSDCPYHVTCSKCRAVMPEPED